MQRLRNNYNMNKNQRKIKNLELSSPQILWICNNNNTSNLCMNNM